MHPQDRAAFEALLAQVKGRPGVTHEVRVRVRHKNGGYRLLEGTITDLCVDQSVGAIVFNYRDITERVESETRRCDAERYMARLKTERFEMVARATNDIAWDWNLATDQLWWNENLRVVFGYEAQEVGAYVDSWTSRMHPED